MRNIAMGMSWIDLKQREPLANQLCLIKLKFVNICYQSINLTFDVLCKNIESHR